jgi:hypothetical protein
MWQRLNATSSQYVQIALPTRTHQLLPFYLFHGLESAFLYFGAKIMDSPIEPRMCAALVCRLELLFEWIDKHDIIKTLSSSIPRQQNIRVCIDIAQRYVTDFTLTQQIFHYH